MGHGGQHRGARPGGLPPWAWAVVLSMGAHLVLLALLVVVRLPTLQLPVTPPPDAPTKGTVLRVGVVSQGGAVGPPEGPAPVRPPGASPAVPRRAGEGTAPERPDAPSVPPEVEPSAEAAASADTPLAAEVGGPVEGHVGGDNTVGDVAGGTVAGGNVAGGNVAGGNVAGGSVAGGNSAGGNSAGGNSAGGSVVGGSVAAGNSAGGNSAGGSVAGGSVAGGSVAGGSVAGGSVAGGSVAGGAPGADVVGLVHARLAAGAERCYPAAARRYQQRGTAEVRFCVDAAGQAVTPALVKTSGSSLLDAAVGGCVLPAASPFPPAALGQCFTVPVRFGGT